MPLVRIQASETVRYCKEMEMNEENLAELVATVTGRRRLDIGDSISATYISTHTRMSRMAKLSRTT